MPLIQTVDVEVPETRRLHLNLEIPREIPTGKARFEYKIIPFPEKKRMTAEEEKKSIANNIEFINEFMEGILKDQNSEFEEPIT